VGQTNEQVVDTLFRDFAHPDAPGAAVIVIQSGKPMLAKGYGLADLGRNIPCTTTTNFRLASLTKQFTAMAVMILVGEEKLSLDDRVLEFFPKFPPYGKTITIRHLLTHTSGLPDYEAHIPEGTTIPLSDRDVLLILQQQTQTDFTPGSRFHYSNSGYALLALVVQVVSGTSFPRFLSERIFEPLQMNNSLAYVKGSSCVPNRAYGYAKAKNGWELTDQDLTSAVLGDGGVYSSVADLFKWDQALYAERLVSRNMLAEMFAAHCANSDFKRSGYGYGWYIGRFRDTEHVWHYGSTCGFSTRIERFPRKALSLIVLSNRRDAQLFSITKKLIEVFW